MTEDEVPKLFDLIDQLHASKGLMKRDQTTIAIWAVTLQPWSYGQVRKVTIERARENVYRPKPSEIAVLLPPIPKATPLPIDTATQWVPDAETLQACQDLQTSAEQRYSHCASLGIPTLTQARAQGMTVKQWFAMLEERGLTL